MIVAGKHGFVKMQSSADSCLQLYAAQGREEKR